MCADWVTAEEITANRLNNRRGFKSKTHGTLKYQQVINAIAGARPINFCYSALEFDDNSEFDFFQVIGTNTGHAANKLIDTNANFNASYLNRIVCNENAGNGYYARITNIDSPTQVTLSDLDGNIFTSSPGIPYRIFGNRWTCKIAGYYRINFKIQFQSAAVDQNFYAITIDKNGSLMEQSLVYQTASGTVAPTLQYNDLIKFEVGEYLEFFVTLPAVAILQQQRTYFSIQMVAEE